jgi:transposase-like protein
MQQQPMDLLEFQKRFSSEEKCLKHLFALRWPEGYVCPRCGCERSSLHTTRGLYQCSACKYQVSVIAGTIFHKTRTPLVKWFWMIFMMSRQKSGVSMLSLQRILGIKSYKTVWTMGHKIRKAMADRDAQYQLAGLVEMDDAFIGPRKPGPPGRGAEGKAKVVIAVESGDKHAGFAVMKHVPAVDSDQIVSMAQDKIRPGSDVRTDGWRAYGTLGRNDFVHESVIVSKDKQALQQLKWVHVLTANLKGNLRGTYHGVSEKHLGRYLAEFSYRFNRRLWDSQLFNRTVTACVSTSTVTFAELRA